MQVSCKDEFVQKCLSALEIYPGISLLYILTFYNIKSSKKAGDVAQEYKAL